MKAPDADDSGAVDPTAYNNIYMYSTIRSYTSKPSTSMIHQNSTSVKLRVMGDINAVKVKAGDHNTKISGMEFNLFGTSDYGTSVNLTQATSSDGRLSFHNIEKGSYNLQETKTNNDWLLNTNRYAVRIGDDGKAVIDGLPQEDGRYAIENTPRIHGDLKIRKADAISPTIGLEGAEFKLEGTSSYGTNVLMYAESSAGGYTLFKNVEMGTYTLTETKAPEDHVLNKSANTWKAVCDESGLFAIYDGDTALEAKNNFIQITNEPLHKFTILKVPSVRYSEDDLTALPGAEFELSGTSSYGTAVDMKEMTGANGMLTFKGLEPGVYVLKETKAPDGYHKRKDSWAVVVKSDDTVGIDGLKDDGNGNWIVVDEKIPTDKVVITKHWDDGLTGDAANNRPYPNIAIASFDLNEAMNIPVSVTFEDGSAAADINVTLKRNDVAVATAIITATVLKTSFNNQPKYNENGNEYVYTLEASIPRGYLQSAITGDTNGFNIHFKSILKINIDSATAGAAVAREVYRKDPSYNLIAYDMRSGNVAKSKTTNATIAKDLKISSYNAQSNIIPTDISSWTANTALPNNTNYNLGDYYFYRFIYTFDTNGNIIKIQANDNYKSTNVTDPY